MLKKYFHELVIILRISPDGPVLIKSGYASQGTDMCFVTTPRNGKMEVYLPGSSLKGVFRSHCERICRTLQAQSVCEPFNVQAEDINDKWDFLSCGQVFNDLWKEKDTFVYYGASCPTCRMFGSLQFKGRCFLEDAYCVGEAPKPYIRDGVGIDRFTGGTSGGAKYDFEVITEGTFETQLKLVNFEMWQLELLLFALRDLQDGEIRLGMGSSRGLGKIKTQIQKIEYCRFGKTPAEKKIWDITALETDVEEKKKYIFDVPKITQVDLEKCVTAPWRTAGIRNFLEIPAERLFSDVATKIQGTLAQYLDKNPQRAEIKKHYPAQLQNGGRR